MFCILPIPTITQTIDVTYRFLTGQPPQPDSLTEFDSAIDSYHRSGLPIPLECLPLCGIYAQTRVVGKIIFSDSGSDPLQQELENVQTSGLGDVPINDAHRKKTE